MISYTISYISTPSSDCNTALPGDAGTFDLFFLASSHVLQYVRCLPGTVPLISSRPQHFNIAPCLFQQHDLDQTIIIVVLCASITHQLFSLAQQLIVYLLFPSESLRCISRIHITIPSVAFTMIFFSTTSTLNFRSRPDHVFALGVLLIGDLLHYLVRRTFKPTLNNCKFGLIKEKLTMHY